MPKPMHAKQANDPEEGEEFKKNFGESAACMVCVDFARYFLPAVKKRCGKPQNVATKRLSNLHPKAEHLPRLTQPEQSAHSNCMIP
jgi:hypothetical protein